MKEHRPFQNVKKKIWLAQTRTWGRTPTPPRQIQEPPSPTPVRSSVQFRASEKHLAGDMLGMPKSSVSGPILTQTLEVSGLWMLPINIHLWQAVLWSPTLTGRHYSVLSSHSDLIKDISGKMKAHLRKEDWSRIWSSREHSHQDTLSSIPSDYAPSAIKSAQIFIAHWIKSKNCSLWNESGLVRTLGIQS